MKGCTPKSQTRPRRAVIQTKKGRKGKERMLDIRRKADKARKGC